MSMRAFLQSPPTVQSRAIIETYQKRADTINKEYFGGEKVLKWQGPGKLFW